MCWQILIFNISRLNESYTSNRERKTDKEGEKIMCRKRKQIHKIRGEMRKSSKYVPRKRPESVLGTWLTRVLVCDAERDTSGGVGLLRALDVALTLVPVRLGGIAARGQISHCHSFFLLHLYTVNMFYHCYTNVKLDTI